MGFPAAIDLRRGRPKGAARKQKATRVSAKSAQPARASWRFKLFLSLIILALVLAGCFMLVRDSSLVRVEDVRVKGLAGHYDKNARDAVIAVAGEMTTLNFDKSRVEAAAAEFVDVAAVEVTTDFPHGATIHVRTRRPVVIARINGRTVTLSQDGEIFTPTHAVSGVPTIDVPGRIEGNHVVAGKAHQAVQVLGAAPDILLRKISRVAWGKLGIVVSLKNGADLYFGSPEGAKTKWKDAAAVLASDKASGAAYLDLRVPGRVAVGGIGGAPVTQSSVSTPATTGAAESAAPIDTTPVTPQTQAQPQQQPQPTPTPTPAPQAGGGAAGGAAPAQ